MLAYASREAAKTPSIQFSGAPCRNDARWATIVSRLYRGTVIANLPFIRRIKHAPARRFPQCVRVLADRSYAVVARSACGLGICYFSSVRSVGGILLARSLAGGELPRNFTSVIGVRHSHIPAAAGACWNGAATSIITHANAPVIAVIRGMNDIRRLCFSRKRKLN
jgi:hypothetical protein